MLLLLFLRSADKANTAWEGGCPPGGVGAFQDAAASSARPRLGVISFPSAQSYLDVE